MINVNDYMYFVHVIEKKGFSAAGRALGIPKSRLSRHINQLEERLDVRLIQRDSRRFVVTEIGKKFYQHARAVVDEIEAAEAAVKYSKNEIAGDIRLTCSIGVAQFAMKDLISRFMTDHPRVNITQYVTNANVDLIEEGLDLAIRGYEENLPDTTYIQRKLAPVSWIFVAGSEYLRTAGLPTTPEKLSQHSCLKVGSRSGETSWNMDHENGVKARISFYPRLCSDDMVTLMTAAKDGLGIVALPEYVCRRDIEEGQLIHVLPEWTAGNATVILLTPTRKGTLPEIAAFSDFLVKEFRKFVTR